MPIYEFACDDCGKEFEKLFRSTSVRKPPTCPHCDSRNVHKKFSTFATAGGEPGKGRGGATSCATCSSGSCATCGH
jgi:putative FmdB family regulatory protein